MRNLISFFSILLVTLFTSCQKEDITYTVSFDSNGGTSVPNVTVISGNTITEPNAPTIESGELSHWELDGQLYDFAQPVTSDITLKAICIEYGETEFTHINLNDETYNNLAIGEQVFLKAKVTYQGEFSMSGASDIYIEDYYGNIASNPMITVPGGNVNYNVYYFPLTQEEFDYWDEFMIFKVQKSDFWSGTSLGFGDANECNSAWFSWDCDYVYGIDYFNEILRGNVKTVSFEKDKGIVITLGVDKTVVFSDLDENDIDSINSYIGKNVIVHCMYDGNTYSSIKDHDGNNQIYVIAD